MNYKNEIINLIKKNRISTTEVADALGKNGVLPQVLPIKNDFFRVGPVKCIFTANESNWAVHEQVRDVSAGDIVIVYTHNCNGRAILGDLVAKFVLLYQQAEALVVDGPIRDVAALRRENFPVWSRGVNPVGCFNKVVDPFPAELEQEIRDKVEGGVAVCDDGGVVIIPKSKINEQMLGRLNRIEMQEDIWFFCLDTLKWDTKKIVCDKAYLTETNLLAHAHLEQLRELGKSLDG